MPATALVGAADGGEATTVGATLGGSGVAVGSAVGATVGVGVLVGLGVCVASRSSVFGAPGYGSRSSAGTAW